MSNKCELRVIKNAECVTLVCREHGVVREWKLRKWDGEPREKDLRDSWNEHVIESNSGPTAYATTAFEAWWNTLDVKFPTMTEMRNIGPYRLHRDTARMMFASVQKFLST